MTRSNPRYHIDLNVKLDDQTDTMLEALAASLHCKKSHVVREGIRIHHEMSFSRRPRCADGNDCRMPQLHVYPSGPTPPNPGPPPQPANA